MRRALEDGREQIGARKQVLKGIKNEQHVPRVQIAEQICGGSACPANERPRLSPIAETI
jgi:hypothetical protein